MSLIKYLLHKNNVFAASSFLPRAASEVQGKCAFSVYRRDEARLALAQKIMRSLQK